MLLIVVDWGIKEFLVRGADEDGPASSSSSSEGKSRGGCCCYCPSSTQSPAPVGVAVLLLLLLLILRLPLLLRTVLCCCSQLYYLLLLLLCWEGQSRARGCGTAAVVPCCCHIAPRRAAPRGMGRGLPLLRVRLPPPPTVKCF